MQSLLSAIIPIVGILILVKILSAPLRWAVKLVCHVLCGFGCLILLNACSSITGIVFPINLVTAAISGILGAPGVLLLLAAQFFL